MTLAWERTPPSTVSRLSGEAPQAGENGGGTTAKTFRPLALKEKKEKKEKNIASGRAKSGPRPERLQRQYKA